MLYKFEKPFSIQTGGNEKEITFIELPVPSAETAAEMSRISAFIGRIISSSRQNITIDGKTIEKAQEVKEKAKQEGEQTMNCSDFIAMMEASGVNPAEAFDALKGLLRKTKAMFEGDCPCTGGNYSQMPFHALREILGFYCINFFDIFQ